MASSAAFRAQLDKLERQQRLARLRSSMTLSLEHSSEHTADRTPMNTAAPLTDVVADSSNGKSSSTFSECDFNPRVGMRAVVGDAFTRQRFLHHQRPDAPATLVTGNRLTLREYLRDASAETVPCTHRAQPSDERPTKRHPLEGTDYLASEMTNRRTRPSTASAVLSPGPATRMRHEAPAGTTGEGVSASVSTATAAAEIPISMAIARPASAMLQRTRGRLDELLREEGLRLHLQRLLAEPQPTPGVCAVTETPVDISILVNTSHNGVGPAAPDSAVCDVFVQEVSADDDDVDPSLLDDSSAARWTVLSRPTSAIVRKPPMILRRAPTPSSSAVDHPLRYRPPSASPAASVSRESEALTPLPTPEPLPALSTYDAAAPPNDGAPACLPSTVVTERPVSASHYAAKFREKLQGLQSATSIVQSASSRALLLSSADDRQAESGTSLTPASAASSSPSSRTTSVPKRVEFSLDDVTPASASVEVPSDVECFVSSHFFSLKALNEELGRLQTALDQ